MRTRAEQIKERRESFTPLYKPVYDRAVAGKGMRSAITAQCLDCCACQREEITLCTDMACPLYRKRPYQAAAAKIGQAEPVESTNSPEGQVGRGSDV